jgi:hypothetical protein
MSAHTLGPWNVNNDTDISGIENDPKNGCVGPVDVAHVYLRTVPGRTEANARLIAAAPYLLEALQNLENDDGSIPKHAWDIVQNAIKKAIGNKE